MAAVERELTLAGAAGRRAAVPPGRAGRRRLCRGQRLPRRVPPRGRGQRRRAAPDGRDPARQHRRRDVAAVAQPAHAQRRGAARQRGLAPGARQLRQADRAASRGAADPDAQRRRAQRHGADQAPPPAAHLRHPADRSRDVPAARFAVMLAARAGPHRQPGADARPRIDGRAIRNGSRAARPTPPSCSTAPTRRPPNGPSSACARPTAWSWCAAADDDLPTRLPFEIETGPVGRGVPSPPRAGAAARRPRSQARLDRADAGGRALRPASSCPARHPCRHRPAGAAADRPCGRRRHGGRRRARLHPYRRRQGAARLGRADRPGRRHQHGRHRRRRRRLALDRRRARRAFPRRLRRQQSAQRLHAAADLALRRTARHAAAAHCRSARRRSRT